SAAPAARPALAPALAAALPARARLVRERRALPARAFSRARPASPPERGQPARRGCWAQPQPRAAPPRPAGGRVNLRRAPPAPAPTRSNSSYDAVPLCCCRLQIDQSDVDLPGQTGVSIGCRG